MTSSSARSWSPTELDPREVGRGYDQAAPRYDELHGRVRHRAAAEQIEAPFRALGGRVLELGCGTGRLLERLEGPRYGLDVSAGMLEHARGRGLDVVLADAHAPPFAAASFDAIFAGKGVFRYLDAERALAACGRLLRPGGLLGIHQYSARTWSLRGRRKPPEPLHLDRGDELLAPAERAGFRVLAIERWRTLGAPPYAVRVPPGLRGRWWSQIVLIFRRCGDT